VSRQGRHDDACALLRQALGESAWSLLVLGKPAGIQRDRALLLRELARGELKRGDHTAACAALEEGLTLEGGPDRAPKVLQIAELLLACRRAARADGELTAADRERVAGRYADRALDALRKAVALEPKLRSTLEKDATWAELRPREDFKKLLHDGGDSPPRH
jgi:hypothetical protein